MAHQCPYCHQPCRCDNEEREVPYEDDADCIHLFTHTAECHEPDEEYGD